MTFQVQIYWKVKKMKKLKKMQSFFILKSSNKVHQEKNYKTSF